MKYATIKIAWTDNKSLGKTLMKISESICKNEMKNGISHGTTHASFVVSEIEIEKKEREVRYERINEIDYLIVKSKL